MLCSNIICTLLVLILVGLSFCAYVQRERDPIDGDVKQLKGLRYYLGAFTMNETRGSRPS